MCFDLRRSCFCLVCIWILRCTEQQGKKIENKGTEFSAQHVFEQWPSLQTNPHLSFTDVFNCPPQDRHRFVSNLCSLLSCRTPFFPPFTELKLCSNDILSHLQANEATATGGGVPWRTNPKPDQWSMWRNAAVGSAPERLLGAFSFIVLSPVDRWDGWKAKCNRLCRGFRVYLHSGSIHSFLAAFPAFASDIDHLCSVTSLGNNVSGRCDMNSSKDC